MVVHPAPTYRLELGLAVGETKTALVPSTPLLTHQIAVTQKFVTLVPQKSCGTVT